MGVTLHVPDFVYAYGNRNRGKHKIRSLSHNSLIFKINSPFSIPS